MEYFAGIDIGSLSTEAVILAPEGTIAGCSIVTTGTNSTEAGAKAMSKALAESGLDAGDIKKSVATGYGRLCVTADKRVTEITCHAIGASYLFPEVGTVIDIGGQDSKVIHVGRGGKVLDFTMNDKCAAGTGRFLEVMAARLDVDLDRLGELSLSASREVNISSVCTVFAESEVVSLIARNHPKEEIVRGLHCAVVNRIMAMVKTVGIHGLITMTGGVAKNRGILSLMEEKLGRKILVHSEPQIIGALGAAFMAMELRDRSPSPRIFT